MGRLVLSAILGLFSVLVFFIGASMFEVKGKTSVREVLAGCIFGALYLAISQFLVARTSDRRPHPDVESAGELTGKALVIAMLVPLFPIFLIIIATAKSSRDVVAGLSMMLFGCLGTIAGALLARRVEAAEHTQTAKSRTEWLMILRIGGGLLLAVALILVGVVIPLAAQNTSYRLQWGTLGPVGFIVNAIPHVLLAALIFWRSRGGRLPVIPGVFGLILAFLLVLPAHSYTYGPEMRLAAVVLFACAGIDLVVGLLSLAAAVLERDLSETIQPNQMIQH